MRITKYSYMISLFRERNFNRFEAEQYGDHCLPTTVSDLKKRGYQFKSKWERVKNRFGSYTYVKRYWLISEPNLHLVSKEKRRFTVQS